MAPSILHYDIFVCSVVAVSMYRLDEEIELDFVFLFFMTRFCVGEFFSPLICSLYFVRLMWMIVCSKLGKPFNKGCETRGHQLPKQSHAPLLC